MTLAVDLLAVLSPVAPRSLSGPARRLHRGGDRLQRRTRRGFASGQVHQLEDEQLALRMHLERGDDEVAARVVVDPGAARDRELVAEAIPDHADGLDLPLGQY